MSLECPYKSLVFFDIESTGLPHEGPPHITEISFVACSTAHFRTSSGHQLPRVLHKLSLCVNPQKPIPAVVAKLTGLDNFLLDHESTFNEKTLELIFAFLNQLQQPICLIAHNGPTFDFPILARYCTANNLFLPVKCVDSLTIFKKIEADEDAQMADFIKFELEMADTESAMPSSQEDMFASFDDESCDAEVEEMLTQALATAEMKHPQIQARNELTPNSKPNNDKVPPRKQKSAKRNEESPSSSSASKPKRPMIPLRLMFSKSFKLIKIYERFFGVIPAESHRAEDDVMMLLKCACFKSKTFLSYILQFEKDLQEFVS